MTTSSSQQQQHDRHHYLTGLEGVHAKALQAVRQEFAALYQTILSLLQQALAEQNVALACQALAAWSLDFTMATAADAHAENDDAAFLRQAPLLPAIKALLDLSRMDGDRRKGRSSSSPPPLLRVAANAVGAASEDVLKKNEKEKMVVTTSPLVSIAPGSQWTPWPLDDVRAGLAQV